DQSKEEQIDSDFVSTVAATLDPAAPSIGIVTDNTPEALAFAGIHRTGLPIYAKHRLASGAKETLKLVRQVVERFVGVHPFAELSLSIDLIEPTPAIAAQFYQGLAYDRRGVSGQVRLRIFAGDSAKAIQDEIGRASVTDADAWSARVHVEVLADRPD